MREGQSQRISVGICCCGCCCSTTHLDEGRRYKVACCLAELAGQARLSVHDQLICGRAAFRLKGRRASDQLRSEAPGSPCINLAWHEQQERAAEGAGRQDKMLHSALYTHCFLTWPNVGCACSHARWECHQGALHQACAEVSKVAPAVRANSCSHLLWCLTCSS